MPETEKQLKKETDKWLKKLKETASRIVILNDSEKVRNSVENIHAYIKDSEYFIEKKDFIRAFEAVVYAWGILETCERLDLIKTKNISVKRSFWRSKKFG